MNKLALKSFATEARRELHEKIMLQARKLGITPEAIQQATLESSDAIFIDGKQLSDVERKQHNKLITRINEIGYDEVIKEAAYTWFNRFIALRFMEVNDYLPTKVRVLSSVNPDSTEPDMFKEALNLDLPIDKELVYNLKIENKIDELFRYLIKVHCNDLNHHMPFMFETIEGYTEVLFPEGLLGTDTFVRKMTDIVAIPEEDWTKVEIVGWLYQYYISEEKDEVFANLKKNVKITKDKLPAATQLFTPNWIVRYMVENSLGKIWIGSYPNSALKEQWKYFLDETEQEESVKKQLEQIRHKNVNPEEITFLDPCCGSGHILVYAFDVFYDMYLEKGYIENEIPQLILSKNLFGLDVDDRAVQLASFAVMMKAREKSRRVFRQNMRPNICAIQDSDWLTDEMIQSIANNNKEVRDSLYLLKESFDDAKEYGSLLSIENSKWSLLDNAFEEYTLAEVNLLEFINKEVIEKKLPGLIRQAKILNTKFDVVCTNPPYMGNKSMDNKLKEYLQQNFEKSKSDLFAVFIEACLNLTKKDGYCSLVTMHSWMFLSSFENLRKDLLNHNTVRSILHLGMEAFEGIIGKVVQTVAFVIQKNLIKEYRPVSIRLVDYYDSRRHEKENQFFNDKNRYTDIKQNEFSKIPGNPIAYWLSERAIGIFEEYDNFEKIATTRAGMITGNNHIFMRQWFEVSFESFGIRKKSRKEAIDSKKKWFPYNKGGDFRKWYGNNEYVVNWENDGYYMRNFKDEKGKIPAHAFNLEYIFKENITWSSLSTYKFSARYSDYGFLYDASGSFADTPPNLINYLLGYLCSKVTFYYLSAMNPTLNFQKGNISVLPTVINDNYLSKINNLVKQNIEISKNDWDSFETSWDFNKNPLLYRCDTVEESFWDWFEFISSETHQLKSNEEELNKIFIEIYELKEELNPNVDKKDITLTTNPDYRYKLNKDKGIETNKEIEYVEIGGEKQEDAFKQKLLIDTIKDYISYATGCLFGRYSLDKEGLIYAGGKFDISYYKTFQAEEDNILPILHGAYFEDDIVTRFVDFVRVTFSEDTLEENLEFIADAIGRKKTETAREAIRRYFLNDFYKDHVQIYKKRPIYWLFTSGKEKAFNCLIYMHRYDKTTLSRVRTDYVHEVQNRMDAERTDLLNIINGDSTVKDIAVAKKELKSLEKKIDELKKYDELLHHMADQQIEIDLDDGVKHNYELFKGLVAKI